MSPTYIELCRSYRMTTKPCRACAGFGHVYNISVCYQCGPAAKLYEKHVVEERSDCKACNGSGQQPLPTIRVTDDLGIAEALLEDTPDDYNEHLWLIKAGQDNLIMSIVMYGVRTNCGIFYCAAEWFNAKRLAGFRKSPTLEQLLANGYKAVYWMNDGERQDPWFREGKIYYAQLVE